MAPRLSLSTEDIQGLIANGVSPTEIRSIQDGTANAVVRQKIQQKLQQVKTGQGNTFKNQSTGLSTITTPQMKALLAGGLKNQDLVALTKGTAPQSTIIRAKKILNPNGLENKVQGVVNAGVNAVTGLAGKVGINLQTEAQKRAALAKRIADGLANSSRVLNTGATKVGGILGRQLPQSNDPAPGLGSDIEFPDAPILSPIDVPDVTMKDFSPEANARTTAAYAPVFQALENSKKNIQEQGSRTSTQVGGLYGNLVNDIAAQGIKNQEAIAGNAQQTRDAGTQLGQGIGEAYGAANTQVADQLSKLGIQAAAPELLQRGANDQAWQQGQAATNTNAMGNYWQQKGQGAQAQDAQYGNLARQEGAAQVSDIANRVGQMLFGVDQNIASTQSERSKLAIDLANQLSQMDIGVQTTNAGNSLSEQTGNNSIAQQNYQNRYTAAQDAMTRAMEAQAQIAKQQADDRQYALDVATLGVAQANAKREDRRLALDEGVAQAKSTAPDPGLEPTGRFKNRVLAEQMFPGAGKRLYDDAMLMAQQQGAGATGNLNEFLAFIRARAIKNGDNQDAAAMIAAQVWQDTYGNSEKTQVGLN